MNGGLFVCGKHGKPFRSTAFALRREWIENLASPDCPVSGLIANNEAVAAQGADSPVEYDLCQTACPRLEHVMFQQCHSRHDIDRTQMKMHRRPVAQGFVCAGQQVQPHIQTLRRPMRGFSQNPVAAPHILLVEIRSRQIERAALTRQADSPMRGFAHGCRAP